MDTDKHRWEGRLMIPGSAGVTPAVSGVPPETSPRKPGEEILRNLTQRHDSRKRAQRAHRQKFFSLRCLFPFVSIREIRVKVCSCSSWFGFVRETRRQRKQTRISRIIANSTRELELGTRPLRVLLDAPRVHLFGACAIPISVSVFGVKQASFHSCQFVKFVSKFVRVFRGLEIPWLKLSYKIL
jgi:hypothetical protein